MARPAEVLARCVGLPLCPATVGVDDAASGSEDVAESGLFKVEGKRVGRGVDEARDACRVAQERHDNRLPLGFRGKNLRDKKQCPLPLEQRPGAIGGAEQIS